MDFYSGQPMQFLSGVDMDAVVKGFSAAPGVIATFFFH